MKKKCAAAIAATVICATLCAQPVTASANSASPYWTGADGTGIYLADGSCPLQVKSENLTFDITGFPADGSDYSSRVTADYTFYNPESYDVTARMLFPFGTEPEYYYDLENWSDMDGVYGVTVNGESVEAELRYSYDYYDYEFDFEECSAYLSDEKVTVNNLSEGAAITKVTVGGTEKTDCEYAVVNYTLTYNKTTILTNSDEYTRVSTNDGTISAYIVLELADCNYFYIIGDAPTSLEINEGEYLYGGSNGYSTQKLVTGESLTYSAESAGTLGEFLESYNVLGDGKYSEVDWFNLCVYAIDDTMSSYWRGYSMFLYYLENSFPEYGVSDYCMRWYDYELTVEAYGYATNAVTAPTYPTIDQYYDPLVYQYNYLLSPAATWDSFENLTITINAPYYLLDGSVEFTLAGSVEEGTSVYTAALESLPDGELSFSLSLSDSPSRDNSYSTALWILIGLVLFLPAVCLVSGIVLLILFAVRRHKRKKYEQLNDVNRNNDL